MLTRGQKRSLEQCTPERDPKRRDQGQLSDNHPASTSPASDQAYQQDHVFGPPRGTIGDTQAEEGPATIEREATLMSLVDTVAEASNHAMEETAAPVTSRTSISSESLMDCFSGSAAMLSVSTADQEFGEDVPFPASTDHESEAALQDSEAVLDEQSWANAVGAHMLVPGGVSTDASHLPGGQTSPQPQYRHDDVVSPVALEKSGISVVDNYASLDSLHNLALREVELMPSKDYMDRQPDINEQMRGILVDWLVEVTEEYKLKLKTLYHSISIVDRYLARRNVNRDRLQLVGVTAMWIAAKKVELSRGAPNVEDFSYISDNTCRKEDIIRQEVEILEVLQCNVLAPTTWAFLERYQRAAKLDMEVVELSCFVAELTLLSYQCLGFEPSRLAASAVALGLSAVEQPCWSADLGRITGFRLADLTECMTTVLRFWVDLPNGALQAIREKYAAPNPHLCVANIPAPDTVPGIGDELDEAELVFSGGAF